MGISNNTKSKPILLNYDDVQPFDSSSWDGAFQTVSLFGVKEISGKNAANIHTLLLKIGNYIKNYLLSKERPSEDFISVVKCYSTVRYGTNSRVRIRNRNR